MLGEFKFKRPVYLNMTKADIELITLMRKVEKSNYSNKIRELTKEYKQIDRSNKIY